MGCLPTSCCCCCRKVNPEKNKLPDLFVQGKNRKCTDLLCLVLFLLFWVGMAVIAAIGFAEGNPEELLYGNDYQGRLCGTEGRGKRIYFPRITEDLIDFGLDLSITNPLDIHLFGVCVERCPDAGDLVCTEDGDEALSTARTSLGTPSATGQEVLADCRLFDNYLEDGCQTVRQNCWDVPLNTTEFFFRVVQETCQEPDTLKGRTREDLEASGEWDQCIAKRTEVEEVTEGEAQTNPLFDLIYSSAALFGRMMDDVRKGLPVILVCGGGVAFVAGFLWLLFVKSCAGCMVWTTIVTSFLLFVACTFVAYYKAGILTADHLQSITSSFNERTGSEFEIDVPNELDRSDKAAKRRWEYTAYVLTGFLVILFALIIWARKTIRIAIGIIKEASAALKNMKTLLLYPLVTFLLLLGLVSYWVFTLAYVASTGSDDISSFAVSNSALNFLNLLCPVEESTNGSGETVVTPVNGTGNYSCDALLDAKAFEPDNVKRYMLAYHFFGLLWTNQLIQAIGIMIVSGAVGKWYFTMDKKEGGKSACCRSTRRTCRFHLGSAAFGALIIAIIQFIRAVLAYLDRKSQQAQKKSKLVKCLFNKFAYVIVAIKGTAFCPSAKAAVMLMLKNAKRLVVVETITTFLFFLGKLFIVLLAGLAAFLAFDNLKPYQAGEENELDSILVPMVLVLLLSYVIGTTFLGIYHLAIETILVCFCEDYDRDGAGTAEKPYFMSDQLRRIVGASARAKAHDEELEKDPSDGEPKPEGAAADYVAPAENKGDGGYTMSTAPTTAAPAPGGPGGYGVFEVSGGNAGSGTGGGNGGALL